ncbi:alpha/beta fold hydrolase [Bradyrhizobium cenepequi]|uniref:alpha/beta fold hydrolase n=1 Tax=Bradyrhizobium cenepequi TaxID=2821403 RepID=UPI001CE2B1DE|nr:alpha/beta hydrolase [Bradyrhizobium cenepequi]MCA6112685.1 alpha/beta hydrolase [Bradyrhizobium cenepequi]
MTVATIRRIAGVAVLAFLAGATAQAETVTASPHEDMVCSADAARADRDMALHEQVALTANGPIGYYRFGQGSPLVLITGYRAALSEWSAYFLTELAKKHEVIVFDNRGIGRSASDIASYRVDDLARDTLALIKALNFDSVSVLGWSMGGMIAQRLVLDNPGLVKHLVLLSSQPPGRAGIPVPSHVEEILSGSEHGSFKRIMGVLFPASVEQLAERCFVGDMFKPQDYQSSKVSPAVTAAQERVLQDWQSDEQSFERLRQLEVQTLVLTGTEDMVLDQRNSVILSETIPHANLVKTLSGGHAMMYQYPKLLAHEIDSYQ